MAFKLVGASPQDLGLFTSILAAGSISGGLVLQRHSLWLSQRPGLLLGSCGLVTALGQLGLAIGGQPLWSLAMAFAIGAGTAVLLSGANLICQVGAPPQLRGRTAGLAQIAFLGGGGLSGRRGSSGGRGRGARRGGLGGGCRRVSDNFSGCGSYSGSCNCSG